MATVDIDIRANVDNATKAVARLAGAFKGLLAGLAFKALIDNIEEAENAAAQLDAAFKATGRTLGLTRDQLDGLATDLQKTTKFSDDLVKQAESVLLTFNRVRGEAFERTIKSAADLSARLGIDLVSATRLLGKSLQDPANGLAALRRSGIVLSDSQKELIKNLAETGQRAKAQTIILAELEKRFGGSAAAARGTLAGALEGLKNSFGDLFEGTKKGTSEAAGSINKLSAALADPKLKGSIDKILELLAKLASLAIGDIAKVIKPIKDLAGAFEQLLSSIRRLVNPDVARRLEQLFEIISKASSVSNVLEKVTANFKVLAVNIDKASEALERLRVNQSIALTERRLKLVDPEDVEQIERLTKKLANLQSQRDRIQNRGGPSTRPKGRRIDKGIDGSATADEDEVEESQSAITEIVITQQKRRVDANQQVLDELDEQTKTSSEKQIAEFEKTKAALEELRDAGEITKETFDARFGEALDELLPEIDTAEIRSKFKEVETQASESALIIRGAFEQAGASIQASLSEAIQNGKFNFRSLVDVARKAFADIAAAYIEAGLKKLFLNALLGGGGVSEGSFGGTGAGGGSLGGGGTAFAAGGGLVPQGNSAIVGEEGPELVSALSGGGLKVFNKRQQRGSPVGGASVIYSPTTNINIIEREDSEKTKAEIFQLIEIRAAKDREQLYQKLAKNGVTIR